MLGYVPQYIYLSDDTVTRNIAFGIPDREINMGAVYHDPQVLVMDEATSALDGVTESVIMEAIEKLTGSKTIILIAHRLSTLVGCNQIYILDRGSVTARGNYHELMRANESFQQMARVAE